MVCKICEQRKPRRECPGVGGAICSPCCGENREVTVDCPFSCPYLQEAHEHERKAVTGPSAMPNADVQIDDSFYRQFEGLIVELGSLLRRSTVRHSGVLDSDARMAIAGLIRTYRTLQTGLVYESRPENPIASAVFEDVKRGLEEFRAGVERESGASLKDRDVLQALVVLERLAFMHDNGRPKGRPFLALLQQAFSSAGTSADPEPDPGSLIIQA